MANQSTTKNGNATSNENKRYMLGIEDAFAKVSQLVFSQQANDFSEVIRTISENLNIEYFYVYHYEERDSVLKMLYEWQRHNENALSQDNNISVQDLKSWQELLIDGYKIAKRDNNDLPPEVFSELQFLFVNNIQSIIIMPIISFVGEFIGVMIIADGVQHREWKLEDVKLLQVIAEMIGTVWEQKRIKLEMDNTIRQYQAMINTVPAIMFLKDAHLTYVEVNKYFCNKLGKSRDEIIGRSDENLFSPENAQLFRASDLELIQNGKESISYEIRTENSNGSFSWMSTEKVILRNRDGQVIGLVGLTQDTTDEHLRRQQMIQTDKLAAIGTLAAGVAHEINNPIGFISSNLNTMKKYVKVLSEAFNGEREIDEAEHRKLERYLNDFNDAINESIDGAERVKKIVTDLKSFSRVDKAEGGLTDINEGIESTINIVWNELKYKCTIEKDLGQIPPINCYGGQINQVILNLLMNAGQAISDSQGVIKIKTCVENDGIIISVKDTGHGIPEKNINEIFNPFYTTKDIGQGTGLGLSLVYDIIQKHDGTIQVSSEVDIGTEFRIWLPIIKGDKEH
ncbi:MAG: PAS domain S-box protein [candidate division Zixibacteria bacterium]|nr:PAS domain S-box protein [candidate division Zixibacteria bacterium]